MAVNKNNKNAISGSNIKAGRNILIGDIHLHEHHGVKPKLVRDEVSNTLKELEKLLSNGKVWKAIACLADFSENQDQDIYKDVLLLSGRWEAMSRKEQRGTLSVSELTLERNQISSHFLDLLERFRESVK